MKALKITFWISTGLLSAMMLFSAGMYIFNSDAIFQAFENLGYPTYLMYPLATAKVLGVIAILTRKVDWLKEWAYAGFFFDFALAAAAHIHVGDGDAGGAFMAMVLLFVSYFTQKKAFSK